MTSFSERHTEHVRLTALRFLNEDPDYRLNAVLLGDALDSCGLGVSRDVLRTQLEWLAEQGLVTLDDRDGWLIVTLTERGVDVARGQVRMSGIARPRPGQ